MHTHEPAQNKSPATEQKLWDFHCRAVRIAPHRYRIELTSASGRRIVREGCHPLWELLRALGFDSKKQQRAAGGLTHEQESQHPMRRGAGA